MSDYISREDAITHLFNGEHNLYSWEEIEEHLKNIQPADVMEQKSGKWIWDENGMDWGIGAWRCSVCGCKPETWWESDKKYIPMKCSGGKYCGNCGAKMK